MRRARVLAEISVVHPFPFRPLIPHPMQFTCIQPCRVRAGRRYCARKRDFRGASGRARVRVSLLSHLSLLHPAQLDVPPWSYSAYTGPGRPSSCPVLEHPPQSPHPPPTERRRDIYPSRARYLTSAFHDDITILCMCIRPTCTYYYDNNTHRDSTTYHYPLMTGAPSRSHRQSVYIIVTRIGTIYYHSNIMS